LLRRGLGLARELRAVEVEAQLTALASSARIPIGEINRESRPGPDAFIPGLTAREQEVLGYIVAGHTYSEIASELHISAKTVSTHVSRLLAKSGASNRIGLATLAVRGGAHHERAE
jgi:DNA-binding NarL/FixJ family response regulator